MRTLKERIVDLVPSALSATMFGCADGGRVGEDTHNSIGESAKSHGPEEENNTGFEEKAADISMDNDSVKADVVEFDIS